jgi:hypothetical protein
MSAVLWTVAAVLAGLAMTVAGMWTLRRGRRGRGAPLGGERVPLTALQKIALGGLAAGVFATAAVVVMVAVAGPEAVRNTEALRLAAEALLVVALVVLVVPFALATHKSRSPAFVDERDREILARAPAVQVRALIVAIAAWTVVLTEAFRQSGQVPVFYLTLIFWTCVVVAAMALPIGVLLGYRSA